MFYAFNTSYEELPINFFDHKSITKLISPVCYLIIIRQRSMSHAISLMANSVNSSPPGQNGRHVADDIFIWNEKFCILIRISLKFVVKGPIDNK